MNTSVPTLRELEKELRRTGDQDLHPVVLLLMRNGVETFDELHRRCKHAPSDLQKLRGVGHTKGDLICHICHLYTSVVKGECSDANALDPADTLAGMQQRGKLRVRTYEVLSQTCSTMDDVFAACQGSPANFSALCEGLGCKGKQEVCLACEQHLDAIGKPCAYLLERDCTSATEVPDVYLNNLMRALGISYEAALCALRYGTSCK